MFASWTSETGLCAGRLTSSLREYGSSRAVNIQGKSPACRRSAGDLQMFDFRGPALGFVEHAANIRCLLGDCVGDVVEHFQPLGDGGVLRSAVPAGFGDGADVGQHGLITARAAQLVP